MKVLFINHQSNGFAEEVELPDGFTVAQLLGAKLGTTDPKNYKIRVNREIVPANRELKDGDRITATPMKVDGA